MLIRFAVCSLMGAARLVELAYSRRNLSRRPESQEGAWSHRTYPLVVALHALVISGTALLGGRTRLPWLLLLAAAQPLRAWVLWTLRGSWDTRGAVSTGATVRTGGPYAFVRHPNYLVVAVELAALPLAFGLAKLAAVAGVANAALLAIRIRDEELLLRRLPGYDRHFAGKARFIPRVF